MFNGLTAKDIADWLALNPNDLEVAEALARAFSPVISADGTMAFDTGMPIKGNFDNESRFLDFCDDHNDHERYY